MARWWPSLVAILLFWSAVTAEIVLSIRINGGHFVYALDDSYILMAMAKNVARHGVWGMTPFGFSSSSSAPLWTALVAVIYWVFGVNTATPLLLNLLCATLLIVAVQRILESLVPVISGLYVLLVQLSVLFFSPMLNLIFIGLEHTLHILLALVFVFAAAGILADEAEPSRRATVTLIALGMALGSIRYEGLFAIGVVAAMLLVRGRLKLAIGLAILSLTPPFIVGAISVSKGWFWLPNSVVLKGNVPMGDPHPLLTFLGHAANNTFYSGMRVVRLMGVALLLALWRYTTRKRSANPISRFENPIQSSGSVQAWMLIIFVATAALHLLLASTGWFLRYEAYLIALGLFVAAVPLWDFTRNLLASHKFRSADLAAVAAVAVLVQSAGLFWDAGYSGAWMTLPGMHDTYRWHYQMATFVKRYYEGSSVVVADIGAADFMADIHLTDPKGLADPEIARDRLREQGQLDPKILDAVARSRGARVALVDYDWVQFWRGTFGPVVPNDWILAGAWKYHNRVVLNPTGLGFYALDKAAETQLIENLRDFSRQLPADVDQTGPYRNDAGK